MEVGAYDLMAVSETWNLDERPFFDKTVSGYRALGVSHPSGRDGVAIIAPKSLALEPMKRFCFHRDSFAIVVAKVEKVAIAAIYVPNGSSRAGIQELLAVVRELLQEHPALLVLGDFNARIPGQSDPSNAAGVALQEFLRTSAMERAPIRGNTYLWRNGSSVLDHALVSEGLGVRGCGVDHRLRSDHVAIWVVLDVLVPKQQVRSTNWAAVVEECELVWPLWDPDVSVDENVECLIGIAGRAIARNTRMRTLPKHPIRIFWDEELEILHGLRRRSKWDRLRFRRAVQRKKRKAWRAYCGVQGAADTAKKVWGGFRTSRGSTHTKPTREQLGRLAHAFEAAHHVRPELALPDLNPYAFVSSRECEKSFEPIEDEDVDFILRKLSNKTTRGPDGLPYTFWKNVGPKGKMWLRMCLNVSLYHGEVPRSWKFAYIVPIEKKDGGFRPISLIDSLAKIVENVVYWRWTKHWPELVDVIPENQFARKLGCPAAIGSLLNYVESSR
jgi:hypothetical protein